MSSFKDAEGRNWIIAVNVPTIKAVRELDTDNVVNLAETSGDVIDRLEADLVLLVDVLWVLCEKQAKEAGVTEVQFGEALLGDAIEEATKALIEAMVNFTPGQRRLLLRKAIETTATVRDKGTKLALAKLEDPELMAKVEAEMEVEMDRRVKNGLMQLTSAMNSPDKPESK